MLQKKTLLIFAAAVLIFNLPRAQAKDSIAYGNDSIFTSGGGSRADGMAGAFAGASDDVSAIYYNPAGLSLIKKQEAALIYYPLFENSYYGALHYGQPILGIGAIGASLYSFSTGNIEGYDENGQKVSDFDNVQYKMVLSYSRKIIESFYAGINTDIYYSSMQRFNYAGFGCDLGLLYEPYNFFRAGITVKNLIQPVFSMQSDTETLPRSLILGFFGKYKAGDFEFKGAYDMETAETQGIINRFGLETSWLNVFALRFGYGESNFSFGAGIQIYDIKIDYAFITNNYFGRMDRYTFSYLFGMTLEEQRLQRRKAIYGEVRRMVDEKIKIKIKEEAEALYRVSYAYYQKNEYEEALLAAEKALEWKKDYEPAVKMKKILEEKLKEKLKTDEGKDLSADNETYISAGIELYEKKQYDEAIKQWELALKSRPGNKALKALIEKAKKDMSSSGQKINLSKEQKETAEKMYYIGVNQYTEGDLKAAVETWKKVLAINPEDIKTQRDIKKAQAELEELQRRGIE